jgi:type III restriction enzyme
LARRVEADEVLNTVELFLPHYDQASLEVVLNALRSPDAHEGVPSEVVVKATEYGRNPQFGKVFEHLETLKTYSVERVPKMSEIKRALRLSGLLMQEGINPDADEQLREKLTAKLADLRDAYAKKIKDWGSTVREGGEIEVAVSSVEVGSMNVQGRRTTKMALSEENVDQLFEEAGRMLAAGEGLHRTYWKRFQDRAKPGECKLELFAIVRQGETLVAMEKLAAAEFKKLYAAHKQEIHKLPAADRARFTNLLLASGKPVEHDWELPDRIVEKPGTHTWENHLYVDVDGKFTATLNQWEAEFLTWAQAEPDFICWLRNMPRRDWAFCVPYDQGGDKPFFPDFLIVRKQGKQFIVDILEPHDSSRLDTWAKVRGLAKFAQKHEGHFGRLMVGRKVGDTLQTVDVADHEIRAKAIKMGAPADLEALFEGLLG